MELHKRCALQPYPFMGSISCLSEQRFKTLTIAFSDPSAKPNTDPVGNQVVQKHALSIASSVTYSTCPKTLTLPHYNSKEAISSRR